MPEAERVSVHVSDGVADVRLNRPEKRNALDVAMFQAIVEASNDLATKPGVRAVVLSGEGKSFCAGLDMSSFQAMADRSDKASVNGEALGVRDGERITNLAQQAAYGWT